MNIQYQQKINELSPWFHNIHLPDGTQTFPDHFLGDFPYFKWKEIAPHLPEDLSGWKILDVGCNAGFYTLELAKRGAMVTAVDIDEHYLKQADWIRHEFGLENQISLKQLQVYDLAKHDESYDMVWFMGVFYHLRYPVLALDILSKICKKMMVFQTLMIPDFKENASNQDFDINDRKHLLKEGWPKMSFIEDRFAGDPTNWWLPNHAAVKSILKTCGFKIHKQPAPETYLLKKEESFDAVINSWNRSEFLSAIQKPWKFSVEEKTGK